MIVVVVVAVVVVVESEWVGLQKFAPYDCSCGCTNLP